MPQAREELADLVAIRSVADPRQFPPKECARAASWVRDRFAEVGFSDTRLVEIADGSRAVVGSRPAPDSLLGRRKCLRHALGPPTVTVLGIECPPVVGAAAIVPRTAARLNLRIPPWGLSPPGTTLGQGGAIPLCNVFAEVSPDAEIILMGVEEPLTLVHAPNESVDPSEIANMALAEALFLQRYATTCR